MTAVRADAPAAVRVPALQVRGLRITAGTGREARLLVDAFDLDLDAGECVAVVGESGSGKSLTTRAITGLLAPGLHAAGSVRLDGQELVGAGEATWRRVRGRRIALLPQDPFTMLSPLRTVAEQIRDGAQEDLDDADIVRRLAEVGVGDPGVAGRYPFQLSGGLRQRVGLAAALASDPDILLADEPSTALDVTSQRKVLALLQDLRRRRRLGLLIITHDLRVAFAVSDRVVVLYAGATLEIGPSEAVEQAPLHPYTRGLMDCEPAIGRRAPRLRGIPGSVPRADAVADSCAFAGRCPHAQPVCRSARPPARPVDPGHVSACVRVDELRPELAVGPGAQDHAPLLLPADLAPVLEVVEVRRVFPGRRGGSAVRALDGVSITVGEGEAVGVVGESGSGKSTLARVISGLEAADAGSVRLLGVPAGAAGRAGPVQVVFQDPSSTLNPARAVGAILADALRAGGRAGGPAEVAALLARVALPEQYARRKPVALSGGERQRVAIARAIAPGPRLLLADEPVSALDVSVQAQVLELLRELQAQLGIALVFITHDLAVVRQVVHRLYVLKDGKVVESGPVDEVLDRPAAPYTRELIASVPRSDPGWLAPSAATAVG